MNGMAYGKDMEVVQRLKLEPLTEEEREAVKDLDPVDFEIFSHKMNMIAQEGKETTMKLGASQGMRWGDVAFAVFTISGDLAVVATGLWFHAVLGQIPVKFIVKHWINEPSVGIKEGDSFFFNDPFYCGVHAADMGLAVPVFYEGKLVCFTGAVVHTGECGASEPGGMPLGSKSKYDEGLLIPPIKIGEDYKLKEDILTMFGAMVRDPRTMILDIKARLAACRIAERRIREVIDRYGRKFFIGGLRNILSETAEAAKKKVEKISDGIYRQPRFMDTLGTEDGLLKIQIQLEKRGEKFKLTFKDTSPMTLDRPMNTFFQGIVGLAMVYLCGWFFYDLPANNGLLEVLDWEFPENTLINATGDVPTSLSPFPQTAFVHGMFLIGARMLYGVDPLRAVASWYVGFNVPYYGGLNQFGEPIADITPEINATGCGARPDMDGVDGAGSFFATMADCSDVETTESDRPFLYVFRNYFRSGHAHGKFRGGNGIGFGLMVHHVPWVFLGCFGFGSKFPTTMGIFGGYAVPTGCINSIRQGNLKQLMTQGSSKVPTHLLEHYEKRDLEGHSVISPISVLGSPYMNGDVIFIPVGAGAGYGDVLDREPDSVMEDLRNSLATHWAARTVYKIVYDETTLRVDKEATERLRQSEREARKKRGVPYEQFEKGWLAKKPRPEILRYYGNYPNPSEGPPPGPPVV
jgi:acetophenone carboxylase